jgi:NADP-dependent 3-hydroxy acid dehydrogenase YdfG
MLFEGLRKEHQDLRVSVISPSFTVSELNTLGGDLQTMARIRGIADQLNMPTSVVADAIAYAIDASDGIDVGEIVLRPTVQAG